MPGDNENMEVENIDEEVVNQDNENNEVSEEQEQPRTDEEEEDRSALTGQFP